MDPQQPYYSSQDIISPDIDMYYRKVIKTIDAQRSTFNIGSSNINKEITLDNLDSLYKNNEISSTSPQESRCSAFFRMIGFPVVNAGCDYFYSPGFNPDINTDEDKIKSRLEVANSCLTQFKDIFNDREFYQSNIIKYFQAQDVNSTALGLSSIFSRIFGNQLQQGLAPNDIDDQIFTIPDRQLVILSYQQDQLSEDLQTRISSSTHIIKPFVVDPRADFSVTPAVNRICAPFLSDKTKTQITPGNYLKRPFIERVIRTRFDNTNILPQDNASDQSFIKSIIEFAKSNVQITDKSIVDSLSNTLDSLHKSELVNIAKLTRVIEALIVQLVECRFQIEKILTKINWKPIPNVSGPEYGCAMNEVDSQDSANRSIEVQINDLNLKKILNITEFNLGVSQPDTGSFVFDDINDMVADAARHNSDYYDRQLNTLNRQRNELGSRAANLLKTMEIITGEFSGLGLLDVLAVQTALWAISPASLLGLIDADAFSRMQLINSLNTSIAPNDILKSLTEFEKQISGIYQLMSFFYSTILNADKKTQLNS